MFFGNRIGAERRFSIWMIAVSIALLLFDKTFYGLLVFLLGMILLFDARLEGAPSI